MRLSMSQENRASLWNTYRLLSLLTVTTVLLGGLPFLLYYHARATGILPSEAEFHSGNFGNHSAWVGSWVEGFLYLIWFYFLLIPLAIFAIGCYAEYKHKQWIVFIYSVLLACCQYALLITQFNLIGWAID
jgi:hypothetical protein